MVHKWGKDVNFVVLNYSLQWTVLEQCLCLPTTLGGLGLTSIVEAHFTDHAYNLLWVFFPDLISVIL